MYGGSDAHAVVLFCSIYLLPISSPCSLVVIGIYVRCNISPYLIIIEQHRNLGHVCDRPFLGALSFIPTPIAMDPVVPQEVIGELTQILSNLVLGDNDIRARYSFIPFLQFFLSSLSGHQRGTGC